jgi:hypothetical protein
MPTENSLRFRPFGDTSQRPQPCGHILILPTIARSTLDQQPVVVFLET